MTSTEVPSVLTHAASRYLQLHLASNVGPVLARRLIEHFGTVDDVLSASISALKGVDGVGPHTAQAIVRTRDDGVADREVERAAKCGVRILCLADPDYPDALRHINDPPTCLYLRGNLKRADAVAVAIVGTRRCSHYGREQAIRFGELLGRAGFTVVSGLARGIDAHSHHGALRAGGRTIAVLGNGLASVYPSEHESLAADICDAGALISEFPIDAGPEPGNFPRRNRIITGLSLGVLVIEAGARSGALITARLATEYNREVFALPGPVDRPEWTAGTNGLIRDGAAKLVTCLDDILDELAEVGEIMGKESESTAETPTSDRAGSTLLASLTPGERALFRAITGGAEGIDSMVEAVEMPIGQVMPALTSLQIKGLVRQLPGGRFNVRRAAPSQH